MGKLLCPVKTRDFAVCARDQLNHVLNNARGFPMCIILNTDVSSGKWEHWLALYVSNRTRCELFDSYACPPNFYSVHVPCPTVLLVNKIKLQSESSSVCGHYCIYYLALRSHGFKAERILSSLNTKSIAGNDRYVGVSTCEMLRQSSQNRKNVNRTTCTHSCRPLCECERFI